MDIVAAEWCAHAGGASEFGDGFGRGVVFVENGAEAFVEFADGATELLGGECGSFGAPAAEPCLADEDIHECAEDWEGEDQDDPRRGDSRRFAFAEYTDGEAADDRDVYQDRSERGPGEEGFHGL